MTILLNNSCIKSIEDWVTKITVISVAFSNCLYLLIFERKGTEFYADPRHILRKSICEDEGDFD